MIEEAEKQVGAVPDPDIVTELVTADKLVTANPCRLYSFIAVGLADATNLYYLRDGDTVAADIKVTVATIAYTTVPAVFAEPVRFKHGLFVQFATNGAYVFVQYKPDY